jgi:hypothetical protein
MENTGTRPASQARHRDSSAPGATRRGRPRKPQTTLVNGEPAPDQAAWPSWAQIRAFLPPDIDQELAASIWPRVAPALPPGCAPQVAAAVVLGHYPTPPGTTIRTLPPPGEVWPDAVLADLESFLPPGKAEGLLRSAISAGVFRLKAAGMPERVTLGDIDVREGMLHLPSGSLGVRSTGMVGLRGVKWLGDLFIYPQLGLNAEHVAHFVAEQRAAHLVPAPVNAVIAVDVDELVQRVQARIADAAIVETPADTLAPASLPADTDTNESALLNAPTESTVLNPSDYTQKHNQRLFNIIVAELKSQHRENWPREAWPQNSKEDREQTQVKLGLETIPRRLWERARVAAFGKDKLREIGHSGRHKPKACGESPPPTTPGRRSPGEW